MHTQARKCMDCKVHESKAGGWGGNLEASRTLGELVIDYEMEDTFP